jgi:hypothetical protein
VTACLLAASPIFLSPLSKKATTDGVVLFPSEFIIIVGAFCPCSCIDTQEFVVPKSLYHTYFHKQINIFVVWTIPSSIYWTPPL